MGSTNHAQPGDVATPPITKRVLSQKSIRRLEEGLPVVDYERFAVRTPGGGICFDFTRNERKRKLPPNVIPIGQGAAA